MRWSAANRAPDSRPSPARRPLAATLAVALLVTVGCGYRVARYGAAEGDARKVAIRTLGNESAEPGVELMVTDALRREFLGRGGLRVVPNPKAADYVIQGSVRPVVSRTKSFSSVVLALEYTVTLSLDLRVDRRDGSQIVLDTGSLQDTEIYLASADVEATRKNREEALRRLAGMIAGRVHDALDLEATP